MAVGSLTRFLSEENPPRPHHRPWCRCRCRSAGRPGGGGGSPSRAGLPLSPSPPLPSLPRPAVRSFLPAAGPPCRRRGIAAEPSGARQRLDLRARGSWTGGRC